MDFYTEFAAELDIFDSAFRHSGIPAWIFDYRERLIRKITSKAKRIHRLLKDLGLNFKICWPVEIDGKWKFADVYFPRQRTVIIVTNPMHDCRPCFMPSERAEFFQRDYRVLEVEDVAELQRKMKCKKRTAG